MKGRGKDFFSGVFLLTLSAICVKLCGLLFKIPLMSIIGGDGMGYFNSAYVIYTFFYVLSTSGLPVGLSILVSGSTSEEERSAFLFSALGVFGGMGMILGLLMLFFPHTLSKLIGNPGAFYAIRIMSPALVTVCLSGCLRGYFQGQKDMMPTALSQVLESVLKTAFGILLAGAAARKGLDPAKTASAGLLGVSIGSVCAFLYLLATFFWRKKGRTIAFLPRNKKDKYIKRLLRVVLPVSAASLVVSISSVIDLSATMGQLQHAGYTPQQANMLYGNYSGAAVPLFNLPAVLVAPVASSVIPFLTDKNRENRKENLPFGLLALRLSSVISAPCALGLAVLSFPILTLLFGVQTASHAAPLLTILAPAVFFVALQTVSGAILQGSGFGKIPVVALAVGACIKIACCYFFTPHLGIASAPIGTLFCYIVSSGINLFFCFQKKIFSFELFKTFLLPILCGGMTALFAFVLFNILGETNGSLLLSIAASVPFYVILLLITGVFDRRMMLFLPFSKKYERVAEKEKNKKRRECASGHF